MRSELPTFDSVSSPFMGADIEFLLALSQFFVIIVYVVDSSTSKERNARNPKGIGYYEDDNNVDCNCGGPIFRRRLWSGPAI